MMSFARFRVGLLLVALTGLGLFAHGADAQVYNRFGPANGILKGDTSTYQTTAATATDAISLWSGTCNATTFLRADGQCTAVPAAVTGANPTATIGLTAVNGSAGTFLRSDGAPALSQAIVPTWTGTHTFAAATGGSVSRTGTVRWLWNTLDGPTDEKIYEFRGDNTGQFFGLTRSDVDGSGTTWLALNRTGTTVDSIGLTATAVTVNGQNVCRADGTGCPAFGGSFANPTATIGLTAVNGVLTSGMRSDAAPALSQAIVPTWTGVHTFSQNTFFTGGFAEFSGATPRVDYEETDAAANNRVWRSYAASEQLASDICNDAVSVCNPWLLVNRTGTTVDLVAFPAKDLSVGTTVVAPDASATRGTLFINGSSDAMVELGQGGAAAAYFFANTNLARVLAGTGRYLEFYANNAIQLAIDTDGSWNLGAGGDSGTAGQVLTSNGSGSAPTWQTGNTDGASVAATGSTACASGGACAIAYATENFDTGNYHDNSTNNSRIGIPTSTGKFQCNATVAIISGNNAAGTNSMALLIRLNGNNSAYVATAKDLMSYAGTGSGDTFQLSVQTPVLLTSGNTYAEAMLLPTGFTTNSSAVADSSNTASINRFSCVAVK